MRARALVAMIVVGALFLLLMTSTQVSGMTLQGVVVVDSVPYWHDFQPTGWVKGTLVSCSVEVYNNDGFFDVAQHEYSTDAGDTWTRVPSGVQIEVLGKKERRLTVQQSFSHSLSENQNQIRFFILEDSPGAPQLESPAYLVKVDGLAPTSAVMVLDWYGLTWSSEIRGTASDVGSGVSMVEITLCRASDGLYYNGSDWQSQSTWLTAAGTANWSYLFAPQEETTYAVRSRSTDAAGNQQAEHGEGAFSYDATRPQSEILSVDCCFNAESWPEAVEGSASDVGSGVSLVEITLRRDRDGLYYNGAGWQAGPVWLATMGTTSWSYAFTPGEAGAYTVQSRATDVAGNEQAAYDQGTFSYDGTLPQSEVRTDDQCFNATSWGGEVEGSASDSESGVAYVQITVHRDSDGLYYDGSSWGATPQWISVTGTTLWSHPFTPPEDAVYTVHSRAVDNCGNVQSEHGEGAFAYDNTPPASEIWTIGPYGVETWEGAIAGSASETISEVSWVEITLSQDSSGQYFNGAGWQDQSVWLTATGTTNWSYPFTPEEEGTYTVRCRAADDCGNVQTEYSGATFIYDSTPPSTPSNLDVVPSTWNSDNAFDLTWNNPEDASAMTAAHFKWDAAPTSDEDESPDSPVYGDHIGSISGLAVPVQGTHQLFLWLEDAAGNADFRNYQASDQGAFKWDAYPPVTGIFNVTGNPGCEGWHTSAVQVTLFAQDVNPDLSTINAISGLSGTFWRLDGGNWQQGSSSEITGEGTHTFEYYSTDVAGNDETPHEFQVKIDTVPPTSNPPVYSGSMGGNGWYTSTVSVKLTAIDATSGVSATYYQVDGSGFQLGSEFEVATEGAHTIAYYSEDDACNEETVQTAVLKIDGTCPATSCQLEGPQRENDWFVGSPVTVMLLASDEVTGVQSAGVDRVYYRLDGGTWQQHSGTAVSFTVAEAAGNENIHLIEYYAVDLAGNEEPSHTVTVDMDLRAPPTINHVPIVFPPDWTNINGFSIYWDENPYDLSGIGGVYYSFVEPTSPTDGTLLRGDDIMSIPYLQVPVELGDGAHDLYIWLRDKAGNSDHLTRREVTLRLDRIPPGDVKLVVQESKCETSEWYNTPITVTFVATDDLSGMAHGVISYNVLGGGGWVESLSYYQHLDGRYTIESRARDEAGNVGNIVTDVVRIDQTAPGAPINLVVDPAGWSGENTFTLSWLNPGDLAGMGGVYYKEGNPPTLPTDGVYVEGGRRVLSGVSAISEGEIPIYVWLVDKACNVDHENRAEARLMYDGTSPTTTIVVSGVLGADGWYILPVQVLLSGEDSVSGLASSHYRIGDDGLWQTSTMFLIETEGTVPIFYYSVDAAGNKEDTHADSVKIDTQPPSSYAYADSYTRSTSFMVRWTGSDASSGISSFDVQWREGADGTWQDWVVSVPPSQTSRLFEGDRGKTYYFRAKATDNAGNAESYPSFADTYVSVDVLLNGDFEQGGWLGWDRSGECYPTRVYTESHSGDYSYAVVLGCPDQESAPVGASKVCQTLAIPSAEGMPAPMLHFRYRIRTYDVLVGPTTGRFYDSFNVGLGPPGGIEPTWVFTDGNRTGNYGTLMDLGWRDGVVDLSPYAGQTIKICLANVTRVDPGWNTWTVVDDVRIINLERRLWLPLVTRPASVFGLSVKILGSSGDPGGKVRR